MAKLNLSLFATAPTRFAPSTVRSAVNHSAIRAELQGNQIALYSPYDTVLVEALKNAIPYTERAWSKERKCWLVSGTYADALHAVVYQTTGVDLQLPRSAIGASLTVEQRMIECRYIGRIKERPDGSKNAFGYAGGQWSVIFPAAVILAWFGQQADRTGDSQSLYGVLGILSDADPQTIKTAYRRAARSWHPDVSREPDAAEQFQRIQHAYDVLSNPDKRAKYAAGLALQGSVKEQPTQNHEWTPPVRCGLILAEGTEHVGRFVVGRILQWVDITNSRGQTLVTSWPVGADTFEERWTE